MKNDLMSVFENVALNYFANDNSLHSLGYNAKKLEDAATKQILNSFKADNKEVIYTSGKCEAINLAIIGYLIEHNNIKHVLVEKGCSDTVIQCLNRLKAYGYCYDIVNKYDEKYLKKNTILVCFKNDDGSVLELDNNIKSFIDFNDCDVKNIKNYSFVVVDGTDIGCCAGIGCLIKNKNIVLEPIVHGGKSTTIYRSGTPVLPLIVIFSKAFKESIKNKLQVMILRVI